MLSYPAAGHVITGNLEVISDQRIRKRVSKGPVYRFLSHTDFNRCREEIASALKVFFFFFFFFFLVADSVNESMLSLMR